jgi:hypothetical protein
LFWIQTPLALFFGIAIFLSIPSSFTSGHQPTISKTMLQKLSNIDYLGATTLTATLILFLFGLSFSKILWTPIFISFFVLMAFVIIETKFASDPIIPISVLKNRGALLSCIAQLGIMAARWGVLFFSPTYAIAVRGWSPASAGSILIPTNLGFAMGGIIAGWLHIKRSGSFWLPSVVTYGLFGLSLLLLSQISVPETPAPWYLLSVFVNGLCIGSALNYTLAHLLHLTPPSTHFISTSLLTTFRGFAGSFGAAIGGGVFVRVLKSTLETGFEEHGGLAGREELVRKLLGSPDLVKTLKGWEKKIAVGAYVAALSNLFLSSVAIAVIVVFIQAGTGWKEAEKESATESVTVRDEE